MSLEKALGVVEIVAKLPAKNLPIRRVLAKLFQSYVYSHLPEKEHQGYKHANGKLFKAMNFNIVYNGFDLLVKYVALDKEHEKKIAQSVLLHGLKIGEIHIANTELSLRNRHIEIGKKIKVKGYVAAAIKDGTSAKKIYLEPKTHKFQEIVRNHTLQKYEALLGTPYVGDLDIKLLHQAKRARRFFYNRGAMEVWHGVYEIEAEEKMLKLILDTGLGAHAMQGVGFVEVV